jgi:pimeloyl-ACP methyl ester carboxylesterase
VLPISDQAIRKAITLRDRRRLGFAEFGDQRGQPLFYFHGFPGSRMEARLADRISRDLHVRFIAIDRPGYGLSSFKVGRTLLDWSDDVCELADTLEIGRFSILGVSGGGPYAAACARKIPERLRSAGIVCGMGPVDVQELICKMPWIGRQGLRLANRLPQVLSILYPFSAIFFKHFPERMLALVSGRVAQPDKIALKNTELTQVLSASFREAFHRSLMWPAADVILYSRPWGFRLEDIKIPVYLWHGENDLVVPSAMGHYLSETIPDCRATFYAEEGHFSIVLNRMEEIWKPFCV